MLTQGFKEDQFISQETTTKKDLLTQGFNDIQYVEKGITTNKDLLTQGLKLNQYEAPTNKNLKKKRFKSSQYIAQDATRKKLKRKGLKINQYNGEDSITNKDLIAQDFTTKQYTTRESKNKDLITQYYTANQYTAEETSNKDLITQDFTTIRESKNKDLITQDLTSYKYTTIDNTTNKDSIRRGLKRKHYPSETTINKDLLTPDYTITQYSTIDNTTNKDLIRRGLKRKHYLSETTINKDLLSPDFATTQYTPNVFTSQDITSNQVEIEGTTSDKVKTLDFTDFTSNQITSEMRAKDSNIYDINQLLQTVPTSKFNIIPETPIDLTRNINQVYEERTYSTNIEEPKPVVPTMAKPTFLQETTSDNLFKYPDSHEINIKDDKSYVFSSPISLAIPKKIKESKFELQPHPTMDLGGIPIQPKKDSFTITLYKKEEPKFGKKEYESTHFEINQKNEFPSIKHEIQTTKNVYPTTTSGYSKKVEYSSKTNPKVEIKKKVEIPLKKVEAPLKKDEILSATKKYDSKTTNIHRRKNVYPQTRKSYQIKTNEIPKIVRNKIEKINTMTHRNKFITDQSSLSGLPPNIPNYDDNRINQLEGYTNSLKSEHHIIQDTLNIISRQINLYKKQIGILEKIRAENEVNALHEEHEVIKQQLIELNNLRSNAKDIDALGGKLDELSPLYEEDEDMESLRKQIRQLNELKRKVAELSGVKAQFNEITQLREQVNQMNTLEKQLQELNSLKREIAEAENLRKKIQEMQTNRAQYEQEIENLRNSQKLELLKKRLSSSRYKNKQMSIKEKSGNIIVKGDILKNMKELEMLTRKINKSNNRKITLNLLYKATVDSDKAEAFHERCDNAESTLVLIETDKGKRFGGYTTCSWEGDCIEKEDEDAFIFSLDKMTIYENIPGEDAIGCYPKFGPIFLGCQIRIFDNAFTEGGTTFEKGLNFDTEEDYELTDGDRVYGVKEIEVYEVIAQ